MLQSRTSGFTPHSHKLIKMESVSRSSPVLSSLEISYKTARRRKVSVFKTEAAGRTFDGFRRLLDLLLTRFGVHAGG